MTVKWTGVCPDCKATLSMDCMQCQPGFSTSFKTKCLNCSGGTVKLVAAVIDPRLDVQEGL